MRKQLASAALVSLMALFLSACATTQTAAISDNAKAALAQAEKDVKEAKAKFALWTTADGALKAAQEAAKKGDSDGVVKASHTASEQAKLGIAQTSYPEITVK